MTTPTKSVTFPRVEQVIRLLGISQDEAVSALLEAFPDRRVGSMPATVQPNVKSVEARAQNGGSGKGKVWGPLKNRLRRNLNSGVWHVKVTFREKAFGKTTGTTDFRAAEMFRDRWLARTRLAVPVSKRPDDDLSDPAR